ncbi:hypothetical protein HYFRA_00001010 [Hymenoscyphus fraxineus]|uniref:Uncharacterized protein n=1 Tax=Hymenoscyphus fraxineus TaxID=746836 RepID=A0A9N9KQJ9_9HELO|nr:hypothetical protein HYFRA_00001010 [Hymenoscyphus fraxineus]
MLASASNPEATLEHDLANLTITLRPSSSPGSPQPKEGEKEDIEEKVKGKEKDIKTQLIEREDNIKIYDNNREETPTSSSNIPAKNRTLATRDPDSITNENLEPEREQDPEQEQEQENQLLPPAVPSWDRCLHPFKEDNLFLDPELERPVWTFADDMHAQKRVLSWLRGVQKFMGTEEMREQDRFARVVWDVVDEEDVVETEREMRMEKLERVEKRVRERMEKELDGGWDVVEMERRVTGEMVRGGWW